MIADLNIDAWVPRELLERGARDGRRRKGMRRLEDIRFNEWYFGLWSGWNGRRGIGLRPRSVLDWRRIGRLVARVTDLYRRADDSFWNILHAHAASSPSDEVWVPHADGKCALVFTGNSFYDSSVGDLVTRGTEETDLRSVVMQGADAAHVWTLRFRAERMHSRLDWVRTVLYATLELYLREFVESQSVKSPLEFEVEVGGLTHRATSDRQHNFNWGKTSRTIYKVK